MTPLPLPPHFTPRAGVLLAAVVVALALVGKATAGCGDHVVVLKPAGRANVTDTPAEVPSPKPPCHGPQCSAGPAKPTPAPATAGTVSTPTAKEQCTPVGRSDADTRPAVRRPCESTSALPIDRTTSIFHPPRA